MAKKILGCSNQLLYYRAKHPQQLGGKYLKPPTTTLLREVRASFLSRPPADLNLLIHSPQGNP
jgi:hypothetical protein